MSKTKELKRVIRELKLSGGKPISASFKHGKYRYSRTTDGYKRFLLTKENTSSGRNIGGRISQKEFVQIWRKTQ